MDGLAISAWRGAALPAEDGTSLRMTSAIAAGDAEAFACFYEQWFDWMYQMARSTTKRDESFCLDVTQNAMLRVVRSMRAMRTEDDLRRWLTRVTHTAALDLLRAEARRRQRERGAMVVGADERGAVGLEEQIESLRQRIERLSPEDRGLLQLRFGRGRTLRVAGGSAGAATAHGRLRRIVQRLREAMEEIDDL